MILVKAWELMADDIAVSSVEYAALLSLIGAGILAAVLSLSDAIAVRFTSASDTVGGN